MAKGALAATSDAARATRSNHAPSAAVGSAIGGVGAIAAALTGAVVAVATGASVAVPIALVAGLAIASGLVDHVSGRIPNAYVLAASAAVVVAWPIVSVVDQRAILALGRDMLAGCVLSGAPVLFVIWVVAPRLIGGGDWKLLAVCGIALGILTPGAAVVMSLVAFGAAIAVSAVTRRRHVVLGPLLALGYLVAVAAVVAAPHTLASSYAAGAL